MPAPDDIYGIKICQRKVALPLFALFFHSSFNTLKHFPYCIKRYLCHLFHVYIYFSSTFKIYTQFLILQERVQHFSLTYPTNISKMSIPSAHQSTALLCPLLIMTSGARYSGVPHSVHVLRRQRTHHKCDYLLIY